MNVSIIINKKAGTEGSEEALMKMQKEFQQRNIEFKLHQVEGADIISAAEHSIRSNVDAIVVGGGDGTINSVASKLVGTSTPLGILPMGTFNHFAGDLGLPESIEECVDVIAQKNAQSVDIAEVSGKIFLNNSSIGVYALAVRMRENYQRKLGWTKRWAMVRAAMNIFNRFPTFTVKLETEKGVYIRKTSFVFVGNNKYTSGKRESLKAGVLSIYTAHLKGRWGVLWMGILAVFNKLDDKYFDLHLAKELELDTKKKKIIVSIDGEIIDMKPPLLYNMRPLQLQVLLPKLSDQ